MSFLYPQFLFGLLAVSIPIIIHLFNFRRPKKILFTNVKFLKNIKETTSSKLKLKHILILISRICFIIFLVLTFAQPFLESKNSSAMEGAQHVSVYLDNSFSMQNELDKEKAIDVGIKSISKISELYPSNTLYNLLTNDFEGKDQFFKNKEKLNERITEMKFSNTFRDAASIYKRQTQTKESLNQANHHIFWFTDFQKSTIGDLNKLSLDTNNRIYLVPVQNKNSSNIYIDSVSLGSPMVKANENNILEVQVRNEGERDINNLILKLYIDNVQVSTSGVNIKGNASAKTKFIFNISGEGHKKCRIAFEDFPITFDNEYFFVLNVSPKIKILHLFQDENKYISNVYSSESIFNIQSSKIGDLDYSLIPVSDLIVLEGLDEIPATLNENLREFIKKGGSIFVFPSHNPNLESYNKSLNSLYLPRISKQQVDTNSQKVNVGILTPDLNNPFFKGFFEKFEKNINMPFAFPVVSWGMRGETLLRLKNESPFLSVFSADKGKVYLCSTPLNNKFTNFQNHTLFVLVMYKVAFNSITEGERLAYSFQEPAISLDIDIKNSENIYSLEAENFKIIPGQRITGRKLIMEIPKEEIKAGFYELKSKDKVDKILAFNYGKEESKMDFYDYNYLKKAFSQNKNVQIYDIDSDEEFLDKFKKENIGIPLWKYSLILCLLFLAIEILLIRFL